MKIENIEVADCNVTETIIKENEINILFSRVYDIENKTHVKNVLLIIRNWSDFVAKIFISNGPFSETKEKILKNSDLEVFDLIQEFSLSEKKIIIAGYSKNSNNWLQYVFKDYSYEIVSE